MQPSVNRQASDRRVDAFVVVLAGTIMVAWLAFLACMASVLL